METISHKTDEKLGYWFTVDKIDFERDFGEASYVGTVAVERDGEMYECEVSINGCYTITSATYYDPEEINYSDWSVSIEDVVMVKKCGEYVGGEYDQEYFVNQILKELP